MKEKELESATIDHALRLLRRIVNHGAEHGLCPGLTFKIHFPQVHNDNTCLILIFGIDYEMDSRVYRKG